MDTLNCKTLAENFFSFVKFSKFSNLAHRQFYGHSSDLHTLFYPMPIYIYTYIPWCSYGLFARHHTPQSIVGKFYSQTFSQTPHVTTVWLGLCTTIGMLFQHRHHAPGHNLPALCCTLLWCVVPVKYSWVVNAR